ncbi:carbon monoxide dehydrogenase [Streptomyces sp. NPDC020965]|uniref:carbon monoxide dehydrogenase n=1 Tax=Streptomyces sp. NPDC020965 TaxID=3365105 RepID=UPI0037B9E439
MEHEVFVPVPAEAVRQVLRDPARLARCVQGFQQDADDTAGPLSGRLKVRIGNHSITYRGTLRSEERDPGDPSDPSDPGGPDGLFLVEGDGVETRGSGSVKVILTIRLAETERGTTLHLTGAAEATGRLAELPSSATEPAAHRLLDRFAERLSTVAIEPGSAPDEDAEGPGPVSSEDAERLGIVGDDGPAGEPDEGRAAGDASLFGAPVPPPALGPEADADFDADPSDLPDAAVGPDGETGDGADLADDLSELDGLDDDDHDDDEDELDEFDGVPDEPPAEAAHARRTMIGRSAEEVDHAPPRGRYAPAPAPDAGGSGLSLRWIAPAAALAVASAVVAGRALRRRK